jgi:hypothetical protein
LARRAWCVTTRHQTHGHRSRRSLLIFAARLCDLRRAACLETYAWKELMYVIPAAASSVGFLFLSVIIWALTAWWCAQCCTCACREPNADLALSPTLVHSYPSLSTSRALALLLVPTRAFAHGAGAARADDAAAATAWSRATGVRPTATPTRSAVRRFTYE